MGWAFGEILRMAGDESHLCFWYDVWCREATLKSLFQELFSIARDKEALVFVYLDFFDSYVHWNLSFLGVVQDWELESLVAFLNHTL
jgi:hypothetical protein